MGLENLKYIHKDKFDDRKRQSKSTVDSFSLEGNLVKISNDVSLFNNPVIKSLEKIKERTFDVTTLGKDQELGKGDYSLETLYLNNHRGSPERIQIDTGKKDWQGNAITINTGRAGMGSLGNLDIKGYSSFYRNGIGFLKEPYIVHNIPKTGFGSTLQGVGQNRDRIPFRAALDDVSRLAQFYTSPAGIEFMAKENITNVAIGDGLKLTEPFGFVMAPPIPVPNTGFLNFVQQSIQGAGLGSIRRPFKIQYSDRTNFGGFPYGNLGDRPVGIEALARIEIPSKLPKIVKKGLAKLRDVALEKVSQALQVPLVTRPTPFMDLSGGPTKNIVGRVDDKISKSGVESLFFDDSGNTAPLEDETNDIKDGDFYVRIKDLRVNEFIYFRGYITGITENVNPSFTPTNYIGRSEPVYQYERGERDLSFNLRVYPANSIEQLQMYKKLEKLTSLAYPEYLEDNDNSSLVRMKAPFTELYMAHIGSKVKGQFGFIKSLSYTVPGEGDWDSEKSLPRLFDISISYQILSRRSPSINTEFYGAYR
jgi:hypothetical protein